jgi:hypothetical protein
LNTLYILIQHLRESIPLTCWYGFQIKAFGYDYTELVSAMRFKTPVNPQNKKTSASPFHHVSYEYCVREKMVG